MLNTSYDEKFGKKGLTFDDVLLIPGESDVEPKNLSPAIVKINHCFDRATVSMKST